MLTNFKKYRPALTFLLSFLGCYVLLNLAYGLYIESYHPDTDPITLSVAKQSALLLNGLGEETEVSPKLYHRSCTLGRADKIVLSIFEGCNGLNVFIIFLSFVIAYRGPWSKLWWFIPLGILVIHIVNLWRIVLLYFVAEYASNYMYFTHKYLFTAIIYFAVFFMWYVWAVKINVRPKFQTNR